MDVSGLPTEMVPWLRKEDNSTSTNASEDNNVLGKDAFLELLITQLEYQDPMDPMDDKEFISQMASFSSLEQMQNLNTGFQNLSTNINDNLIPSMMIQQSGSMIGREVSYLKTVEDEETGESSEKLVSGQVESVIISDGTPYYLIDGKKININQISGIGEQNNAQNQEMLAEILERLEQMSDFILSGTGDTGE